MPPTVEWHGGMCRWSDQDKIAGGQSKIRWKELLPAMLMALWMAKDTAQETLPLTIWKGCQDTSGSPEEHHDG